MPIEEVMAALEDKPMPVPEPGDPWGFSATSKIQKTTKKVNKASCHVSPPPAPPPPLPPPPLAESPVAFE
jgi:hypothetical protein